MEKEKLLYNKLYEQTKDFDRRNQLISLQRKVKQLNKKLNKSEEQRKDAIDYINFLFIFDTENLPGNFKDTIWGKELLELLQGDNI